MQRIDKTVFISYRRTNTPWALAIFQNLTQHGFDVFFDYNGIASGDFERLILGNITSRAHFLVLLTPSALERCADHADWLRREIETALNARRNIVPLTLEGFDFDTPAIATQLTGALAALKHYNALSIPAGYFPEAMNRLREKYLNVPLDAVPHPASFSARRAATEQKAAAQIAPAVHEEQLTAQQLFERGFDATDPSDKIHFYSAAILLEPHYADAFNNRGAARRADDVAGAIQDYNEAIRLRPDYADAFYNRGLARSATDVDGAIQDYSEAIRLRSSYAEAFYNRGVLRQFKGEGAEAIQDYNRAIGLNPLNADALNNRGVVRGSLGDNEGEIRDLNEAIRLNPTNAIAFNNRGVARGEQGDVEGEIQDYSAAIGLDPNYADAFHNRGIARRAKGDVDGALQDLGQAIRLGFKARK